MNRVFLFFQVHPHFRGLPGLVGFIPSFINSITPAVQLLSLVIGIAYIIYSWIAAVKINRKRTEEEREKIYHEIKARKEAMQDIKNQHISALNDRKRFKI